RRLAGLRSSSGENLRAPVWLPHLGLVNPTLLILRVSVVNSPGGFWLRLCRAMRLLKPAFDAHWADRNSCIEGVRARLALLHTLLPPQGSVVVHVDPRTSATSSS
ncbi:MAG: hypothetical protein MUF54_04255, partial [Polyangiaceae bacterium]|nr:hypothetical protein [Polyangiaceae bacterium]